MSKSYSQWFRNPFKNVLFPDHNHRYWWPNTLIIAQAPASEGSSVPVVSRWLWPGNRTFLKVVGMVVTWWIVAFLHSDRTGYNYLCKGLLNLEVLRYRLWPPKCTELWDRCAAYISVRIYALPKNITYIRNFINHIFSSCYTLNIMLYVHHI